MKWRILLTTLCELSSVIRGHYVYKSVWSPSIEVFSLQADAENEHDSIPDGRYIKVTIYFQVHFSVILAQMTICARMWYRINNFWCSMCRVHEGIMGHKSIWLCNSETKGGGNLKLGPKTT